MFLIFWQYVGGNTALFRDNFVLSSQILVSYIQKSVFAVKSKVLRICTIHANFVQNDEPTKLLSLNILKHTRIN